MAKVVAVRPKERRRDLRRSVNLDGLVNDGQITVVDISASGVGAKVFSKPGPFAVGDEGYELEIVPVQISGNTVGRFQVGGGAILKVLKDGDVILEVQVEVVRFDKNADSLGARFVDMTDAQYGVIEKLVTGRPIKRPSS